VHAEITDLLNPESPLDPLTLHCYIPLKFSFKWIKISRVVPTTDLLTFASTWYNVTTTPRPPGIVDNKNDGFYDLTTRRSSSSNDDFSNTNEITNGGEPEEMISSSSAVKKPLWTSLTIVAILIATKLL
jgi:hypothetical protein